MKDNKGFSLIEIIVVLAVMAILVTVSLGIYGLNDNAYVKDNTKSLESMLNTAYYNTQAKAAKYWMVQISRPDVKKEYKLGLFNVKEDGTLEQVDEKILSGKKSEITISSLFEGAGSLDKVVLDNSNTVCIYFEKQTGEVAKLTVGGTTYDATMLKGHKGTFNISSDNKEKNLEIYWSTGKVFAES